MITFAVEDWKDCYREMALLWQSHWREVAIHQDAIPLDPDLAQYESLRLQGMLCVVVARCEGAIVGYYISIIKPHLHYRTTLHAFTDVYYLLPEHRKGRAGLRLIQETMKVWKQRGVKKAFTATKKHLDMGPILRVIGWEQAEDTFCILLGDGHVPILP